jgi:hypothetical protein
MGADVLDDLAKPVDPLLRVEPWNDLLLMLETLKV